MGTHFRELSERYPMKTNMTGFRWFSKIDASKVASALKGVRLSREIIRLIIIVMKESGR